MSDLTLREKLEPFKSRILRMPYGVPAAAAKMFEKHIGMSMRALVAGEDRRMAQDVMRLGRQSPPKGHPEILAFVRREGMVTVEHVMERFRLNRTTAASRLSRMNCHGDLRRVNLPGSSAAVYEVNDDD